MILSSLWIVLQTAIAVFLFLTVISYLRAHRVHMPLLKSLGYKTVSTPLLVVVPAKDEAQEIGRCLTSLSQFQGLEKFKVIAVDDRSTDKTFQEIRSLEQQNPERIHGVHIDTLPPGWLGKNHACWRGVQAGLQTQPDTKYILFTDGDVKIHPTTLAEALTLMEEREISFLTLTEHPFYEGILEPAYLLFFGIVLIFFAARPWTLQNPKGRNFMGNGAFLLIRRDAYEATGGHQTLRLEAVEDMKMGLLMRARGYRCLTAVGLDRIWRRWQPGFTGIFKGLLKNAFAAFEYSPLQTSFGIVFFPLVFVSPWLSLMMGFPILGLWVLMELAMCFYIGGKTSGLPWVSGFLLSPLMAFAAAINLGTSMFKTLSQRGIAWRDTFYSLDELRENCLTVKKAFR